MYKHNYMNHSNLIAIISRLDRLDAVKTYKEKYI